MSDILIQLMKRKKKKNFKVSGFSHVGCPVKKKKKQGKNFFKIIHLEIEK